MLPNWFLCLGALGFVVWIVAGIQVYKAAREMRERNGTYLRFGMPPLHPPQAPNADDADWWKREN